MMDQRYHSSVVLGKIDIALLAASAVLGIAATLRILGMDGITFPATLMLASSAILAIRPLVRLTAGEIWGRKCTKRIIVVVFFAHLIATLFFFPPEDVVNSRPVISLDHALHYQQVERSAEVFWKSFRFHAYDPWFMAGYPAGTIFDIDSKGVELWCSLLSFAGMARAFKLYILLGYLLLVPATYAGCRRLGYNSDEAVMAVLVLLAFWHWGRPYVGEFRFAGMFSFLIVCYLSIYLTGLFRSILREERIVKFWVLGPLTFLIHPTAAVLLPVPFIALFLVERRKLQETGKNQGWLMRLVLKTIIWCCLIVAVNAIWLLPFFKYLDIKIPSETFFQISGFRGLLAILVKPGNLPALGLVALAGIGMVHMKVQGRLAVAAAPFAASVFMFIICTFGVYIPIFDQMEPGRFLVPAIVFLAPLSGAGLVMLLRAAGGLVPSGSALRFLRTASVLALLLCSQVFALLASRTYYRYALNTTFTPEVFELIDALKLHTDPSGRLMIEDGPAWNFGNSFLPAMLPRLTGVEQIGGPYPWTFIKHNFTNFYMCSAMETPLSDMQPDLLREYMALYNVRWVLTSTPECGEYFRKFLEEAPLWTTPHFNLWKISEETVPDEGGKIKIRASYDEIHVTIYQDSGKEQERILLPYHWDLGLVVDPPARITQEMRLDDPVPMILLEPNGQTEVRISFR